MESDRSSDNRTEPELCPACQRILQGTERFCGLCGLNLRRNDPVTGIHLPTPRLQNADRLWKEALPALRLWLLLLSLHGGLAMLAKGMERHELLLDVCGQILSALVILGFCLYHGHSLKHSLSLAPLLSLRTYLLSLGVWSAIWLGMLAYVWVLSHIGFEFLDLKGLYHAAQRPVWTGLLLMVLLPGIFEEIAFRGFIQERMERVGSPREAWVLQAALFSLLHLFPAIFISHFAMGLTLGWLRKKTGSLLPPMLVHMAWNAWVLWVG